jgi:hypothetical protein
MDDVRLAVMMLDGLEIADGRSDCEDARHARRAALRARGRSRAVLVAFRRARPVDDRRGRDADHRASEEEKAAGNHKHGYGFHPPGAYADETREGDRSS